MMRMVASLVILQLQSAMMGMGHGKLKPRPKSEELSMLRAKLQANNDDYNNMMIAEYTPLRITTHAPRFKIIDNQRQTRNPLGHTRDPLGGKRWTKKKDLTRHRKVHTGIQKTQSKNWRLELPEASKASKNYTWHLDSPDYEATRAHKNPGDQNMVKTWEPDANGANSVEKKMERQNSSSLSSDTNETDINYSENSIEATRTLNKVTTGFPTFNSEVEATRVRKNPDYMYTWRTWEAEDINEDDSVGTTPSWRLDSAGNDSESNEATEVSEKHTEFDNTLRLHTSDSEISEAAALRNETDQDVLPTEDAEVSKVTKFNNPTEFRHPWRTWQHFPNPNKTGTRVPEDVKSNTTATKYSTKDYEELNKYWQKSNEREKRYKTTSTIYAGGKHYGLHLRIGLEESDFSEKTKYY